MAGIVKKIMIGFGVLVGVAIALLVLFIVIGIMVGDESTSSVPSEKELLGLSGSTMGQFAHAVKVGDFRELRSNAAQAMKDAYPLEKFNETFSKFQKLRVDWSELERHKPVLEGKSKIDKDGFLVVNGYYATAPQKVFFNLKYMKENKEWGLAWIYVNTKPFVDRKAAQENIPSKDKLLALLKDTLDMFDKAVKSNDASRLYDSASRSLKALHSKEEIQKAISSLSAMKMDFSVAEPFRPAFERPSHLDEEGIYHLKGNYENRSGKRYFELSYVFEDSRWKIAAFDVNANHTMPSGDVQIRLVKETMNAFAQAVLARDFENFYHTRLAEPFKKQYSKDAFQTSFRPFMEQNIDLRVLDAYSPQFDKKPAFDKQGQLVLKGYFPTKPSILIFDMTFVKIGDDWKLMGLFLKMKTVEK